MTIEHPQPGPQPDPDRALQAAAGYASMLVSAGALPHELAGTKLERRPTPVHDLDGSVLFWRAALRGRRATGYLDVAAHPGMGSVFVAAAPGADWSPGELLESAAAAYRSQCGRSRPKYDDVRFVAYSFPKLAVQFLLDGEEVALLELHTWEPVPPARYREKGEPPADFDRWSYLAELPPRTLTRRARSYEREIDEVFDVLSRFDLDRYAIAVVDVADLIRRTITRDLRYSRRSGAHEVCYELRGQETSVWCVGASVQMILDFYRYEYTQVRLAQELGLGTLTNPNGLPYANDSLVVDVLEDLSSGALDATMFTTNPFSRFRSEINANRPLVSFIPGHSRTVAGYTDTSWLVLSGGFRGLCVYDPWPPNAGVITRWENFDTQTYRRTFTAQVTLA